MFPNSQPDVKRKVSILGNDEYFQNGYHLTMEGSRRGHVQRWYLLGWRRKRELTQEALAGEMGTSKSQISKLERYQTQGPGQGRQKLNDEWLERYCTALGVTQRELSEPPGTKGTIDDLLKDASPADRKRFTDMAEAFVKPDR